MLPFWQHGGEAAHVAKGLMQMSMKGTDVPERAHDNSNMTTYIPRRAK